MRIAKGSCAVAHVRFEMAARAIADLISTSPAPLHDFGRLLIRTADTLQSLPPSPPTRPVDGAAPRPAAAARQVRTR
jgi:hypothetical protein